ncbi:MAG TPA: FliH/SctL family protein, partial [Arenibaculum sp.]|nr:FliH/SctL family protein [Arenibaculum sp.]
MSTTRKFLFERSFDDTFHRHEEPLSPVPPAEPEPEPEPEPAPPPEPTFSRAELLQAHEDGYGDGFAAGKAAAENAAAIRLEATLSSVADALAGLLGHVVAAAGERRAEAIGIALTIARKLLPAQERRHGLAEIEAMITECVAELIEEPRLVIRLNDEMLDPIAERIDEMTTARGFAGKVVLLADAALGYGDCRIEWADGGAERIGERLWHDIDRITARVLGQGPDIPGQGP